MVVAGGQSHACADDIDVTITTRLQMNIYVSITQSSYTAILMAHRRQIKSHVIWLVSI